MNYKLIFLSLCTLGLSAGAMSLNQLGTGGASGTGGRTILDAADDGNLEEVKRFIADGADVNKRFVGDARDPNTLEKWGWSPFGIALDKGHLEIARYLIPMIKNIHEKVTPFHSPLMYAARRGHCALIRDLLQAGADINEMGVSREHTPLTSAIKFGYSDVVKCLIDHGADVNTENEIRETPLIFAAKKGSLEIAKDLINAGAHLYHKGLGGRTALGAAAQHKHQECCEVLIEAMLNLTSVQKNHMCAVAFCMRNATENTALPDCELPLVERLCQESFAENEGKIFKIINKLKIFGIPEALKSHLLKKYFPELQKN